MTMQAVDFCRQGQYVANANVNFRAFRHSDQRARALRCLAFFGKPVGIAMTASFFFRIPDALAQLQTQF